MVNTNSRDNVSKTNDRIDKLADQISNLVQIVNKQVIAPAKAVEKTCVTCEGAHAYYDCIATDSTQPSVCAINVLRGDFNKQEDNLRRNLNDDMRNILSSFFQNQPSTSGTLSSDIVPNPKGEMKDVTTRSGLAYKGPSIPTNSSFEKVDEQNTEEIMDKSILTVQEVPLKSNLRLNDQKLREKATNQMEKFFQIIHDLHFDISFADALLLMPKFASTIKSLLANKDKLFELAKIPLNENCSAMLFKKFPEKLGDPSKFLIPCDFPGMELSLPKLTPTRMTLELADRSITRPKGVAEDVFVKVGKFYFPTDFVVVDFEADPRVPLILGRSFLRTSRALIDVYGDEITLRVNDESLTFNLNQTMRYSSTYDDNSINRVDVIDIACEKFVQDVLDFQYNLKSSNPTLVSNALISKSDVSKEPIVKSSSPTLTPFGESDLFLEEIEDFLNDDLIPTGIENFVYDPEGDILFLKKLLNEDPFQLPPMDLKLAEESKAKSFVEEPPELELKDLPSHIEYAFLEDSNKLLVITAKNLKDVEKEALINVLKSHKWAIAWKISNIKGINLRFCTHKILMEDDNKPAVQSQRRVNPKIHDVIKKEVIKLLDAGMIYLISDSPWVSPIHCVPKKGGMTIVANENNELIPTRLVTGWRVCIDYRKLNDTTRKDHFPLPFMDQMLERLAGNEFYCFLDGFSGYFLVFQKSPITHLLEKETPFVFSKECIDAFDTLKKKLTEAPILVVPDWNLPFELMCDVSDYAIGAALDNTRRSTSNLFNLVLSKSIVYTDHSALKYLLNKQDSKPRLLRWVLLIKEFDITILDKKGSENLAADHLSRLENPHKDVLKNQDINENFPLETLGSLSSNSTPWFADIVKFYAGNFIKKGLTSQQKKKFFKDLLISSKLAMRDLLGAIMVPISQRKVDYLSKWVEAKVLPTNDARVVVKFLKSLFSRFGIPRAIISDHGTHFCNDQFTRVMIKYGTAGDHRKLQLNELSELHDQAYENSIIYKEWMKKLHDSKIKNHIFNVFPYGTIELSQPNGPNFKVNGHHVKHYFGGDIPSNVALDLHTFPMDN
nr:reverse transcriptase domain-containing protein [Tanacetum cinerariifolium]